MITKYCVTYLRADGVRTHTAPANQGRYFYDTQEAAAAHLVAMMQNNNKDTINQIFGFDAWRTFVVLPHEAYDHGDLCGTSFEFEEFVLQGTACISNCIGYEVQISSDGEAARLRYYDAYDVPVLTDWLQIDTVENEDFEEGDDDSEEWHSVIDPKGFNIPLSLVMRA